MASEARHSAMTLGTMTLSAMLAASPALAETPLNNHPVRLAWFETANMYHGGTFELNVGTIQTNPNAGSATGNQLYFGGGSYAVNDRLTFGIDAQSYQDPVISQINGANPDIVINTVAFWAKYQLYRGQNLSIAALVSAEDAIRVESPLFGGTNKHVFFGAAKLPVTYKLSPMLEFHVTPSVTVMPDTLGGQPFYGTVASIGAGASFKPNERLAFYGAVDMPVSGNNTITSTGAFAAEPVWVAGGRYNVTPRVAVDAYVTNGVGKTPAMSMLTHWPGGDDLLAGLHLTWTPGQGRPESYRGPVAPVTQRQKNLQMQGFTLDSASTMEPGDISGSAWYGTHGNRGVALSWSPDFDGQLDLIIEDYADSGSANPALVPTTEPRYMFGPKLRLLDQNNGDPFSLSGRMLFGRQIQKGAAGVGVFYVEGAASYQVNDRFAVTLSPQIAAFGNTEIAGLGFGANYELFNGLELIAEATAVGLDASDPTWAAGLRYNFGETGFSVDAHATNAIGRYGIGTMIAQDETKFALSVTKRFNVANWRDAVPVFNR